MAATAATWSAALDDDQRALASWPAPGSDAQTEDERWRWYYVPTDPGGLPLGQQRPPQQSLAMQLLAGRLSTAGYVTVAPIRRARHRAAVARPGRGHDRRGGGGHRVRPRRSTVGWP
ncbi:DUF3500 domain-containing protein [Geodermatophilus sp. SYSU D00697]